jgi:diguanylate cyclase (GGDEF)-like protein/PAS domain S-box-containing protein
MKTESRLYPRIFASLLFIAALFITVQSALRLDFNSIDTAFGVLALTCILVGTRIGLQIPDENQCVPFFHFFVFIAFLLFDNDAVILMAAASGVVYAAVGRSKEMGSALLNSAAPAICVFLVYKALAFYTETPAGLGLSRNLLVTLCLLSVSQATFHFMVAGMNANRGAADAPRRSSIGIYLRTCLVYFVLAAASGFIANLTVTLNLPALHVVAALCAGTLLIYLYALPKSAPAAAPVRKDPESEFHPREDAPPLENLQEGDGLYRNAFEQASIGMALMSLKGNCLRVNRSLSSLLGYSPEEFHRFNFQTLIHPDAIGKVRAALSQTLKDGTAVQQIEARFIHKGGHEIWALCDISNANYRQPEGEHLIIQVQDITERKRSEELLIRNAFHDALTGLPNRALFIDHLQLAIDRTQRREDQIYAVLFIDIDRFKVINDTMGHLVGDHLLVEIARRLESCLRPGDTIARVGGDEFTVLLEDLEDEPEAISIAHRIQKELSASITLDGHEIFNTVSVGIAPSSAGYDSPAHIMRDADTAMYRAKLMGKNRHEIFDKAMHEAAIGLLQLETDLRHALEREEFFIHYQPIVSLDNFRLCGFEALVRWRHPERGLISPIDFIPLAEETGQIISIGQWVLSEACKQMHKWQKRYGMENPLFISVNLSGKQFAQSDLIEQVKSIITETRLNPRGLKLEITETVVMENIEMATQMLQQLRDLGVQLSIDDFGTGYSSLSYLHRFPIDTLKVDKSFVMEMVDNNENIEIVRTIIMLAQNLGMDVIAEGIETKEQLALLRKLKCEKGQGYYFSKPLEKAAAENLLSDTCTEGNPFKRKKEANPQPVVNTLVKSIKIAPAEDMA